MEKYLEVLVLFDSMRKYSIQMEEFTIVNLFQAGKQRIIPQVHRWCIYWKVVAKGLCAELDFRCLHIVQHNEQVLKTFDRMERRDVISLSTMIAGFVRCSKPDEPKPYSDRTIWYRKDKSLVSMLSHEACIASAMNLKFNI